MIIIYETFIIKLEYHRENKIKILQNYCVKINKNHRMF